MSLGNLSRKTGSTKWRHGIFFLSANFIYDKSKDAIWLFLPPVPGLPSMLPIENLYIYSELYLRLIVNEPRQA